MKDIPTEVFGNSHAVTIVRHAGTGHEKKWDTRMGGDFIKQLLIRLEDKSQHSYAFVGAGCLKLLMLLWRYWGCVWSGGAGLGTFAGGGRSRWMPSARATHRLTITSYVA